MTGLTVLGTNPYFGTELTPGLSGQVAVDGDATPQTAYMIDDSDSFAPPGSGMVRTHNFAPYNIKYPIIVRYG